MNYPNAEYGVLTTYLDSNDVRSVIAKQYRTTDENVELSTDVNVTVKTIVKYEEDE